MQIIIIKRNLSPSLSLPPLSLSVSFFVPYAHPHFSAPKFGMWCYYTRRIVIGWGGRWGWVRGPRGRTTSECTYALYTRRFFGRSLPGVPQIRVSSAARCPQAS